MCFLPEMCHVHFAIMFVYMVIFFSKFLNYYINNSEILKFPNFGILKSINHKNYSSLKIRKQSQTKKFCLNRIVSK